MKLTGETLQRYFVPISLLISVQILRCFGQDDCSDRQQWCASFDHLCSNKLFITQMKRNCPSTCGHCTVDASPDDPRCSENNGNCGQLCAIENGKKVCKCRAGYVLASDEISCNDEDECQKEKICPSRFEPYCINEPGSYFCSNVSCASHGRFNRYKSGQCCDADPGETCGRDNLSGPSPRVVGGKNSVIGGWPWMVYILIDGAVLCGGTLIDEQWVVTAGHCFLEATPNSTVQTFYGRLRPYAPRSEEPRVQERSVNEIIFHESWDKKRFPYHDIALLRLSAPLTLRGNIDKICLPNGERPTVGTRCWVTGYGTTAYRGKAAESLQEVDLPIIATDRCKRVYQATEFPINEDIMLCAGHAEGGKDACQGDSGGPLVCQRCESCRWYLAGVVSFGKGCAQPNYFGVYTDVERYEEWISRHTGVVINKNKHCGGPARPRWSAWSLWGECSATCAGGIQARTRRCLNGRVGQQGCQGSARQSQNCNEQKCPRWGSYGAWSACNVTCGGGHRTRTRSCINGDVGDIGCDDGDETQTQVCNSKNCPVWRNWAAWSSCTVTCGGGTRSSTRTCNTFGASGATCEGQSSRTENCRTQECPYWESWGSWNECTASCSGGTRSRNRRCKNGNRGDDGCRGLSEESETCNTQLCGTWSGWTKWSECSLSCGGGMQRATRRCTGGTAGVGGCPGSASKERSCHEQECPRWKAWGSYGSCSSTCGGGSKMRSRRCLNGEPGQRGCLGPKNESKSCNTQPCPMWNDWPGWSECSERCGGGRRSSTRTCMNGAVGDKGCQGSARREERCNTHQCPRWGDYSGWTECSSTCGGGSQTRTRQCNGGTAGKFGCPGSATRSRVCNSQTCPHWGEWTQAGGCSKTCDRGQVTETRACLQGSIGQAGCQGNATRVVECRIRACPSMWTEWGEYGVCSVTCGSGIKTRSRVCEGGESPSCPGKPKQNISCGEPCRTRWGEWVRWTQCSKSCSGGTRSRERSCIDGSIGEPGCHPAAEARQIEVCNEELCPDCADKPGVACDARYCVTFSVYAIDFCAWTCRNFYCYNQHGSWGQWSDCSRSCGAGTQTRRRPCISSVGRCSGSLEQLRGCNTARCSGFTEWAAWSTCSKSCGGGTRNRSRSCREDTEPCRPDEYGVVTLQNGDCQTQACPGRWGEWSEYGKCSTSCGEGTKQRSRDCIGGAVGGPGCEGENTETEDCGNAPCPGRWGDWVLMERCSVTCGDGMDVEQRECIGGVVGGPGCIGVVRRSTPCNLGECITQWGDYASWGPCSASCGGGERSRERSCENGSPGDVGCEGEATQTEVCNNVTCTTDPCASLVDVIPNCFFVRSSCDSFFYVEALNRDCAKTCCQHREAQKATLGGNCRDDPNLVSTCLYLVNHHLCNHSTYGRFRDGCRRSCGDCV